LHACELARDATHWFVVPAHSRSKNGVASLAFVADIRVFKSQKTWMAGTRPAMTIFS
jgi:hypothetical protein